MVMAVTGLLAALTSCEEPVELDIDIPRSQLVIHSNFFPGEVVSLRVSASGVLGRPARVVQDASVSLFEGTDLVEELTFEASKNSSPGNYVTKTFLPRVGRRYTIHVSADGFDPVTAVSRIPEPISIDSLFIRDLSFRTDGPFTIYDYRLAVDYTDPADEVNYYDLRVSQEVIPFRIDEETGDTSFQQSYLIPVDTPQRRARDGETVSVLLRDKLGRDHIEVQLQSRLNTKEVVLGQIVAELRTVSPEYYFYRRSLRQTGNNGLPGLSEPVILFDNVSRGLGVFAGYTSVKRQLHLRH
jgi:hypothetical protein